MNRKLLTVAFIMLLSGNSWCTTEQPNVLFIITDDMYPSQMNFMPEGRGQNYSPNLDRLATEGMVMRNQYVSSTVCTPSRYSVLTGRYASRSQDSRFIRHTESMGQTHVQWNTYIDTDREDTVALRLADAGYRTGFVGKDHAVLTRGRQPLDLDADPSDPAVKVIMRDNARASEQAIHNAGFEYVSRVYQNNPDFNGSRELAVHNQDWITEGALEFLRQDDGRPFFLYFATTIPHGPTQPERSWRASRKATPEGWLEQAPEVQPDSESIARRARANGARGRETVLWLDDAIGALMQALEAAGRLENTVIFFFNDHGQSAKGSLYQGGVHNPSVVWREGGWPGGGESLALVSNIDFAPTLLELAGSDAAANMDGRSFLPVLLGRAERTHDHLFFEMGFVRAVLKDDWKYIALRYPKPIARMDLAERQARLDDMNRSLAERGREAHTFDPLQPFGQLMAIPGGHDAEQGAIGAYRHYHDPDQLYNLTNDPGEQQNLFGRKGLEKSVDQFRLLMQSHLDRLPGDFPLDREPAGNELP